MDSVSKAGLNAITSGLNSAVDNSQKVTGLSDQMLDGIIGLKLDALQVKAGAKVVKTADKLVKNILDILA
jgi:hypothetical protein